MNAGPRTDGACFVSTNAGPRTDAMHRVSTGDVSRPSVLLFELFDKSSIFAGELSCKKKRISYKKKYDF
jgi:hypothetical protein